MIESALNQPDRARRNRPAVWVFVIALLPAVLLCIAIGLQSFVEPDDLFRDPLVVAEDAAALGRCCSAYYGFVSQLGALVWAGGSSIAFFAALVLFTQNSPRGAWQFMAAAGLLTGLLVLDDVFQVHEVVLPELFGIPEWPTIAFYAALFAGFLWYFRRYILELGPDLLIISTVAFAVSVATDLFVSDLAAWHRLAEDGSKLVGITSWTTYLCWVAWTMINGAAVIRVSPETPSSTIDDQGDTD